ncbi:DUF4132 domain-containing protein [Herbidospora cretacea]|uniref:DUF4132 domain-containing protein n=1 Tax=Herbidospora cretacea TaxID=28444 RepID=UPI0007738E50|nr:DUF4132 domain-containing protein [Herbidospora cretacea]
MDITQGLSALLNGPWRDPAQWPAAFPDADLRRLSQPGRALAERLLAGPWSLPALVAAGLAGLDDDGRAHFAEQVGAIAAGQRTLITSWDPRRWDSSPRETSPRDDGVMFRPTPVATLDWLADQPGYVEFARVAVEAAEARARAVQAGEIPYTTKAFDGDESAVGRAVRVALHRDEPWLPDVLDGLVRGIAVAPTQARTLPSMALLYEIARAVEELPTPEAINSMRTARRIARHAGVIKELDRKLKRMVSALAERLDVAFRMPDGRLRRQVGEHVAVISVDDGVELSWWHGDKKVKSVPAAVRRDHPEEVTRLRDLVKQARQHQVTLARALEAGYTSATPPPYRQLAGNPMADRVIWEFEVEPGVWRAELGLTVPDVPVRLWHPARATVEEVRAWREVVQHKEIKQPFKQAFREIYPLTPAEEAAGTTSLRFADHVVVYSRLYALLKDRGWQAPYMGHWEGGYDDRARRLLAGGRWRATLAHSLHDADHAVTGEVRFQRPSGVEPVDEWDDGWRDVPLAEVPPLLFSEAMRDVDLFVGVTSIAADPGWADRESGRLRDYWRRGAVAELSSSAEVRRDALARLLPRLAVADRCTLTGRFLVVRGDLRTYKIHLGSANVLMEPDDAYLCVVAGRSSPKGLFLPFEEDGRLSLIISKALLLADDTAITDPSITRQIRSL